MPLQQLQQQKQPYPDVAPVSASPDYASSGAVSRGSLAPASVIDKPVVELQVQLPQQLAVGGAVQPGPVGVPLVLDGSVLLQNDNRVAWIPSGALLTWLQAQLKSLEQFKRDRMLVRMRLLGSYVWAAKDPTLHIDGQLFGHANAAVQRPRSFAIFPSGNGAGGSDLEMWFWIGHTRETPAIVAPPPGGVVVTPPNTKGPSSFR